MVLESFLLAPRQQYQTSLWKCCLSLVGREIRRGLSGQRKQHEILELMKDSNLWSKLIILAFCDDVKQEAKSVVTGSDGWRKSSDNTDTFSYCGSIKDHFGSIYRDVQVPRRQWDVRTSTLNQECVLMLHLISLVASLKLLEVPIFPRIAFLKFSCTPRSIIYLDSYSKSDFWENGETCGQHWALPTDVRMPRIQRRKIHFLFEQEKRGPLKIIPENV